MIDMKNLCQHPFPAIVAMENRAGATAANVILKTVVCHGAHAAVPKNKQKGKEEMTTDELFDELEGALVIVNETMGYANVEEDDETGRWVDIANSEIQLLESDIERVECRQAFIEVFIKNETAPHFIQIFQLKTFE